MPNPYKNKVVYGNQTLIDLTSDTVSADKLLSGYTAHDKSGASITGTYTAPSGTISIDDDGTYDVTNYAEAEVAIDYNSKVREVTFVISRNDTTKVFILTVYGTFGANTPLDFSNGIKNVTYSALLPIGDDYGTFTLYTPKSRAAVIFGCTAALGNFDVSVDSTVGECIDVPHIIGASDTRITKAIYFKSTAPDQVTIYITPYSTDPYPETVVVEPLSVSSNDTYTAPSGKAYSPVTVNVPPSVPTLQSKTATPTESVQTITADSGYDGLSDVEVGAISSTYVGSGIARKSSTDLTASGASVTAPAGYYAEAATKSVASGSAGTPTASKGTVSNNAITVTPSVTNTTGYITGSTISGTGVSVSASELVSGTLNVDDDGTYDVTNYASAEVAIDYVAKTVPLTIMNHGSVTKAIQKVFSNTIVNTDGFITGSNTYFAIPNRELVIRVTSGGCILKITSSTTASNYELRINNTVQTPLVSGVFTGGSNTNMRVYWLDSTLVPNTGATVDIYDISDPWPEDITVEPLSVSSNGTYTASSGTAYSPVTVSVPPSVPTLQSKSATPTESVQTITADTGYDGLSSVEVGAISSTYVGSGITQRDDSDLTASGATVTVPSGYYASQETKSVVSGSAGTPSATKGTVSNHSVSVTPSVTNTTGYITGGTKTGTAVTVSASELVSGSETKTSNGTYDVTNLASLIVSVPVVTYYTGSSAPSSSLGSNGDIYLQTS